MNKNFKTQTAIKVFELCGFDISFTVDRAIDRLLSSISHFTKQNGLIHDLSHIFANAVKGRNDEEDFAFIIQTKLTGIHLDHCKDDSLEYCKTREALQQRATIIRDFFFTLTGIDDISELTDDELKDYPLCMFGIVSDNEPTRIFSGKHQYRLMSHSEREKVLLEFQKSMPENIVSGDALLPAPLRIDIHALI